jgi:hypothetical protein
MAFVLSEPAIPQMSLSYFDWKSTRAHHRLHEFFSGYEFSFVELEYLVRLYLECRLHITDWRSQSRHLGRDVLRRKISMQLWIHEHWSDFEDFARNVVIEVSPPSTNMTGKLVS